MIETILSLLFEAIRKLGGSVSKFLLPRGWVEEGSEMSILVGGIVVFVVTLTFALLVTLLISPNTSEALSEP